MPTNAERRRTTSRSRTEAPNEAPVRPPRRAAKAPRPGVTAPVLTVDESNLELDGDSTLFHSINRNKQSFAADLKNPTDFADVRKLIGRADVLIQNFRPGVMEKIGLHYDAVKEWNRRLVYASITGYGTEGPWRDKPGQDLLAQAVSGLTWLSGDATQGPVPMGLSVADMFAAAHCVQGILACLVRRGVTGKGGLIEVSLIESVLDLQFEVVTTHLNDGGKLPQRSAVNNGHAYLGAPYGIYQTDNGYLAMAMGSVTRLGELLGCQPLTTYADPKTWFTRRDEIKAELARHLRTKSTAHWLSILEPADVWCADVLTWPRLMAHDGFRALNMIQKVSRANGASLETIRCPIRVDGQLLTSPLGAPKVGEHNADVRKEFLS